MVSTTSVPTPTTKATSTFYLLRDEPPSPSDASSTSNLLVKHGLEETYQKFCGKKIKESLSGFLPNLPGVIDENGHPENTLRSVIDKPPIGGKELLPLQGHALSGFRLNPGPIPEQFRFMNPQPSKKKHKHKKHKSQDTERSKEGIQPGSGAPSSSEVKPEGGHEKKHKKQKKHEDGERKKKKKDKKKKKRHTPDLVPPVETLQPS